VQLIRSQVARGMRGSHQDLREGCEAGEVRSE
jgi:hypothetical protein